MIVYHGSQKIVSAPTYGVGSPHNDYGLGFYCTESLELAKEWACPEVKDGFANRYELNLTGLSVLNLNGDGYHILNWIALLLKNRTFTKRSPISRQASQYLLEEFLPKTDGYDVICGYRADDSYFSYAKDFLNNTISVAQLSKAMTLGELGEQVVLTSEKAFENIAFVDYEIADASIYYGRRAEREERARNAYLTNHGGDFSVAEDDLFVRDLISQKVKNDDPRLR
jgi:hypothetical protein